MRHSALHSAELSVMGIEFAGKCAACIWKLNASMNNKVCTNILIAAWVPPNSSLDKLPLKYLDQSGSAQVTFQIKTPR